MSITGRLFGSIGQFIPAASAYVPITASPGYGAWYARQMARSYAERSSRLFCGALLAA
ncbi:MAG: hypothetical protein JF595_14435 [Sphingomonadales bacterium]|nr:hypothetical protein [Sphingomonadales bacterium]